MASSNYLKQSLLNHIFRTSTYSKPSTIAICLLTTPAVDSDTGNLAGKEVANSNGYSRQVLNPSDSNWTDPTSGTQGETDNVSLITFGPASGADWGNIVAIAITDNSTYGTGNLLFHGLLLTSKYVEDGNTFRIDIGDLNIQLT